jgi:spore coat polysaccharide biosynthesis predicted glycosyltransferase SpsG
LKVLIFTIASPVIGGSHYKRMEALDKALKTKNAESYIYTDLAKFRDQIVRTKEKIIALIDVPSSYGGDLSFLLKSHAKVVGYEYSGALVFDYNVTPFLSKNRLFNAKKEIYSGLEYFILREELIQQKKLIQSTSDSVLITLGAGRTKRNALALRKQLLNQSNGQEVEIIVGKFSKEIILFRPYIKRNPSDFVKRLSSCGIVFTNGGSTLVESIYLGKKIVCWPQTRLESEFSRYLGKVYDFKIINDLDEIPNLNEISELSSKQVEIKIDGLGVDRLYNLLSKIDKS